MPELKPNRTLSVIQNAAMKRKETLTARIKPLLKEIAQLEAILAAGSGNLAEKPNLFPEE